MRVILAEKPSVARDLAAFLGARKRCLGYFEGNNVQVTWALGHLVGLKEPHEYDAALKRWSLAPLPFIPAKFQLKTIGDGGAKKQYAIVKKLLKGASEIVCATDAGREGELIFRYIISLAACKSKPIKRLWLSSLTPEAIGEAFRLLKPAAAYDSLFHAAQCRSEADWVVGLNATRNMTLRYGKPGLLWTVGRVQTPVLALIAERDDQIATFRSEPFWELFTLYRDVRFKHVGDRFLKQEEGQALLDSISGHDLIIKSVTSKKESLPPPQLFDLTELQRTMNRRFGMSAADCLRHAQQLYESKLLTYPRTDSRYLSEDMKPKVPGILRCLQPLRPQEIGKLSLDALPWTKRLINDKKVTDHHAIIPTGKSPGQLSLPAQQVFDVVVTRLVAAFYPPCVKAVTVVDAAAASVNFRARGVQIVDPGWTSLEPKKPNKDDDQVLPAFEAGEAGSHIPELREGKTQPPKAFTENALLGAMDTAGRLVDDEALKEALKERGLGTPATRAAIIETLLSRGYVVRDKKALHSTDVGRTLIALIQDPSLKSAEMTGEWEQKLKQVEQGKMAPQKFMEEISTFTKQLLATSDVGAINPQTLGNCPLCGNAIIQGNRGMGCSAWKSGCKFVLWPDYEGLTLSPQQMQQLLQKHILLPAVTLSSGERVILYLTKQGLLRHAAEAEEKPQTWKKRGPWKKKPPQRFKGKTATPRAP